MTDSSPAPWRIDEKPHIQGIRVVDNDGAEVALVYGETRSEARALAEFILRAVAAYEGPKP